MSNKYPGGFVSLGGQIPSYSVVFDGSGDSVSAPNNSTLALSSGDFSVEWWMMPLDDGTSSGRAIVSQETTGGMFWYLLSGVLNIRIYAVSTPITYTLTNYIGVWTHIAVTRQSGTLRLFVNGILVSSASNVYTYTQAGTYVGGSPAQTLWFNGYISNFRIVTGTAIYTSSFAPPTSPLKNISGTVLLECQSSTIIDNSTANGGSSWTLTANGNAAVSTNQPNFQAYNPNNLDPALGAATPGVWTLSQALAAEVTRSWPMYDPYYKNVVLNLHGNSGVGGSFVSDASTNNFSLNLVGNPVANSKTPFLSTLNFPNGSGYFDGASYTSLTNTSAMNLGTGDFTCEYWIYVTSLPAAFQIVVDFGSSNYFGIQKVTSSTFKLDSYNGSQNPVSTATNLATNTWYHIACVRESGNLKYYINGALDSTTAFGSNMGQSSGTTSIGYSLSYSNYYVNGYLSNLRIVKGTAVYTSAFTPSTTPLTAVSGTSLLTLQTPNPANNNGFVDSSTNNFTITRNGNTTQGSFSPYGPSWSNYFGGSGNYLSNTTAALITASVSTFTAEAWICLTADPTVDANNIGSVVSLDGQPAGTTNYMAFGPISTRKLRLRWFDGASKYAEGSTTLALNTWYHVAVVVTSNAIAMYVNGVAETLSGTTTLTNRSGTTGNFAIGSNYYGATTGYISNLRVTTTAVYSSGFTPSTTPLTAISGTALLTCQSNRFIDNSSNAFALTVGGTPSVQRFQPFLFNTSYTPSTIGGSGYFDGTGDYLNTASTSAFAFGTGDFTIESWVYLTSDPGSGGMQIVDFRTSNTLTIVLSNTGSGIYVDYYNGSFITSSAGYIKVNSWAHVAVVRSSGTTNIYINGVSRGSASDSVNFSASSQIYVGMKYNNTQYIQGYMSDVRVVKGTAITPSVGGPTSPLTAVTNTQLLCNMTNGAIYDNAMMNDLETVGNAQISTSVKKYGTGAMYFDGTGDYLVAPTTVQTLNSGSGQITVEAWVYLTANVSGGGFATLVAPRGASGTSGLLFGFTNTSGVNRLCATYISASYTATSGDIALNTWYHVAFVLTTATNCVMYLNGVAVYTATLGGTQTLNGLSVGATDSGTYPITGYIDDLRITKGYARYVANFTPPTSQLQDQ